MKAERKISPAVAVFLWVALSWTPAVLAEPVRVGVPAKSLTFLNYYAGEKFGLYRAEGLEVSLEEITPKITISGMVSGEIDYTTAIGSAIRAAVTGIPVKATMFSMDRVVLFMFGKPNFKSIEDLKGRKNVVAVTDIAATPAFAAAAMARAHGVNPDRELTFISMGTVANALAALQGGSADVAILSLPFNFKAEELGFRHLGSAADYMKSPFAGVAATDAKLKSNPAQVKRMIRATLKGLEFTRSPANRERVVDFIAEEFKLDRKSGDRALTETIKALSENGLMPEDAVKAEVEDMRERLKIKGDVSVTKLVDYTLLRQVLAEMKR